MMRRLPIHPVNPQPRLIQSVIETLQTGGVIVYPTDSAYALGCTLGNKMAIDRIKKIRDLDKQHNFTLVCRDLSDIGIYARISNPIFRLLKTHTPGAYTFILPASTEVPRRLQHPKRKTIGLRIPNHPICLAILAALNEPLMSVTLILPNEKLPLVDTDTIEEKLTHQVDLFVDAGFCDIDPTTVIDLTEGFPQIIRIGKGDAAPFSDNR